MPDNLIYNIIIKLDNDSEKSIDFLLDDSSTLFIDDFTKGSKVPKGKHVLKVKRHHDFFFDWFIDSILIEEFLVIPLICDEEIISIKSSYPILVENDNSITIESNLKFPIEYDFIDNLKIKLTCLFPSQLSFYFNKNEKDFKTLTLQFSQDNYCKVFLDTFKEGIYLKDERLNLGLFSTNITLENEFNFIKNENKIIVNNSLGKKIYDVKDLLLNSNILIINETWTPNGKGKYLIDCIS